MIWRIVLGIFLFGAGIRGALAAAHEHKVNYHTDDVREEIAGALLISATGVYFVYRGFRWKKN
jgi:hypothetical protein